MSKVLVAYFSASGVTEKMAERLAKVTKADLFEIQPKEKYTAEDLDHTNNKSRSSLERDDETIRPEIVGTVSDLSKYDVIFVGFPVWWYKEPAIIDTFLESADFTGKTIVPFASSGMSPIGDSGKHMQKSAPGAVVVAGKRFFENVSEKDLKKWASEWV